MSATKPKVKYHVKNWSAYNQALIQRGSLTLWVDEAAIGQWLEPAQTGKRGHPFTYADMAVECMLLLKAVYHLPLRQTQGLMASLLRLLHLELPVPHYSTLSRRGPGLAVVLPRQRRSEGGLHVVMDASGLKVYGPGEWQAKRQKEKKRRLWRKIHLGFDEARGEVLACVLTASREHDKTLLPDVLAQIEELIAQVSADKGYDYLTCYEAITERQARAVIPPRQGAVIWDNGQMDARDANLRRIQQVGREEWKKESLYHRRSLAETGIFRLKTIFGDRLSSRTLEGQTTEARLWCKALNTMTALGMPDAYPVLTWQSV